MPLRLSCLFVRYYVVSSYVLGVDSAMSPPFFVNIVDRPRDFPSKWCRRISVGRLV